MKEVIVTVGNNTYKCKIAQTDEDKKKGLMKEKFLPADEGMLFKFEKDDAAIMWMKNTEIPLDQIGIADDKVTKVYTATPLDQTLIEFPEAEWVLEVNAGSGIQEGDEVTIDDGELNKYVMRVISPDGSTQFLLQGGERIFSRKSTAHMIKWAKRADMVKDDKELFNSYCRRLGKIVFKELHAQDNRKPEYVQTPSGKKKEDSSSEN